MHSKRIRTSSYKSGIWAEFMARMYLRIHGYRILKSRYITGQNTNRAEIDIIAQRGNLIIFIEVKRRPNITIAIDAITNAQAARLRRAAETWLSQNRPYGDARFDLIAVCGFRIKHIKSII